MLKTRKKEKTVFSWCTKKIIIFSENVLNTFFFFCNENYFCSTSQKGKENMIHLDITRLLLCCVYIYGNICFNVM